MNSDIRISVTFKDHRKRRRLARLIGIGATHYLINLWISVAESRPDGKLVGWDETDIADASQWTEEPKKYVDALLDCQWVELLDGCYSLHDWEDHQGYVVHAPERSAIARNAARIKWQKLKDATSMHDACIEQTKSNAPYPSPVPSPYPNPYPYPNPLNGVSTNGLPTVDQPLDLTLLDDIRTLYNETCTSLPKARSLKGTRLDTLKARLKEYPDIIVWKQIFDCVAGDAFWSGRDGRWKGCSFDWIIKAGNTTKIYEKALHKEENQNSWQ